MAERKRKKKRQKVLPEYQGQSTNYQGSKEK
jgi:hypothetical protein